MKTHELLEKSASLKTEARTLYETAARENREMSGNERSRFDALTAEAGVLTERAKDQAKLDALDRVADAEPITGTRGTPDLNRYSLGRAIRCALNGKIDGLEGELSAELQRGREPRGTIT